MYAACFTSSQFQPFNTAFRKAISASAHQHEKQWTVDTDVTIRDFGVDLFQDLAVLLGLEAQRCDFHCCPDQGYVYHFAEDVPYIYEQCLQEIPIPPRRIQTFPKS
jgi:hypothetical protein